MWIRAAGQTVKLAAGLFLPIAAWLLSGGCGRSSIPSQEASSKHTLRVALDSDIYSMDPHRLYETTTLSVIENVFETLVMQDSNLKVIPGLASHWETPDDLTWRVHLRRGVMFHNGEEMRSADVKFSYERVLDWPESGFVNLINAVDRVDVVDDYTVDIRLRKPYGVVANLGAISIIPAQYVRRLGEQAFVEKPVGTGPFRFVERKPGEYVKLRAFDDYWRGRPAFDEMVFMPVPSPDRRVDMLEDGQADIAWMIPVRRDPPVNYRAYFQPALHVFYLAFDCGRVKSPYVDQPANPFRDVRVRQAFLYGIDTSALIDTVFDGHAYQASQLVSPNIFGYGNDIKRPAMDRQKARELLAEAGFGAGFTVTLDLMPSRKSVGEFLKADLASIGIRVALNLVPKEEFFKKIYTRTADPASQSDTSMYFLGWACSSGDASEVFEYALHTYEPDRLLGVNNGTGYSNKEVDRLVEESLSTFDSKERLKLLQDAMVLVMRDLPWVPLYIWEDVYGVSNAISYTPRLDDHILGFDARPRS